MLEFLLQGIRAGFWSGRIPVVLIILFGLSEAVGQSPFAECPHPLTLMPRFVDAGNGDLIHVRSGTRTHTREVQADYHRTQRESDRIIDAGFVVLTNRSDQRRMVRYHHSWQICPHPHHVAGYVHFSEGITGTAWFDCNRIRDGVVDRTFDTPQSTWQIRVEAALAPGESIEGWWVVCLEQSDVEYCGADLNHDGQVDEVDLAIGLGAFGASADQETIRMILDGMAD